MKEIKIFNEQLTVHISDNDWDFLCAHRFMTVHPSLREFETEFVCDTNISSSDEKRKLWPEADKRLAEYIDFLRQIQDININKACNTLLNSGESNYEIKKLNN